MRPGHWRWLVLCVPFSILTLMVGWKEGYLAHRKPFLLIPRGFFKPLEKDYLREKQLTEVHLEKQPLNGTNSSSISRESICSIARRAWQITNVAKLVHCLMVDRLLHLVEREWTCMCSLPTHIPISLPFSRYSSPPNKSQSILLLCNFHPMRHLFPPLNG